MQAVDWASPWSFSYSHQRKALYMRMTQTPGSHGYPHWISKNVSSEGDRGENTLVAIFWKRVGRWMSEETLVAEGRNTRSRLSSTSTVTITNTLSVFFWRLSVSWIVLRMSCSGSCLPIQIPPSASLALTPSPSSLSNPNKYRLMWPCGSNRKFNRLDEFKTDIEQY
jgi:hypothetical protein